MGNDTEAAVFEYMKSQNRPYSALDIFNNLHKKIGKTAIVKALETLSEQKKLLEKTYGKSKIYVVHQSQFSDVDETNLQALDEKILSKTSKLKELQQKSQASSSELKSLTSSLTTKEAMSLLTTLETDTVSLQDRIDKLRQAAPCIDPQQKKTVTEQHKTNVSHWKKRKRMTTDLMNAVLEGYPKSKKQFLEDVGLETDEDCSAVIPAVK